MIDSSRAFQSAHTHAAHIHSTLLFTHTDVNLRSFSQLLEYKRAGISDLSPAERQLHAFVVANYTVPNDFETSSQYGPLSGGVHELRVVYAFLHKLIPLCDNAADAANRVSGLAFRQRKEMADAFRAGVATVESFEAFVQKELA